MAVLTAAAAAAGERELTLESIFSPDPQIRVDFEGESIGELLWAADSRSFLRISDSGGTLNAPERTFLDRAATEPLFELEPLVEALSAVTGLTAPEIRDLTRSQMTLSPGWGGVVIAANGDLFHYSIAEREARRWTRDPPLEEIVTFSPDGRRISFVRQSELWTLDLATGRQTAVAGSDRENVLHGKLDWVYQEEIYGRGDFRGHWWSPDSSRIAFLELDQSEVDTITLIDHLPIGQRQEVLRYPKAGRPNPKARLGVVAAAGGPVVWIDTSTWEAYEPLIVRVGWSGDGSEVLFLVQDREQTWIDLAAGDVQSGEVTVLVHETSPAFIDVGLVGLPLGLADGSFLWLSGRSGYPHLYHFAADGQLIRQLTAGPWEVRELLGVDEIADWIYIVASVDSPIERHVHRVHLDGSGLERISRRSGEHQPLLAPDFAHYLDTWSDWDTPPQLRIHRSDGEPVRAIADRQVAALAEFSLPKIEFLQIPAADGFRLEAALLRPARFDPGQRYPVLYYTYGGPHAPTVRDRWGGPRAMWFRFLAQQGYAVFLCDNRSASGKGVAPTWQIHRRLGAVELADIESCLQWLKQKPWIDPDRIGIYGSSYGGYLSAYALTHSHTFRAGIAFAPVTDWRLYDSVYTERYMGRPQNNVSGYDTSSVLEAADRLDGELLLIHGTMDDNVHLQNTLQLVDALQRAGKSFELMLYPTARHGIRDPAQTHHLYRLMTRFLRENL